MGFDKASGGRTVVRKLTGSDNDQAWASSIKLYLQGKGLWDHVVGDDTKLEDKDESHTTAEAAKIRKEQKEWNKLDAQAAFIIICHCSDEQSVSFFLMPNNEERQTILT